MQNKVFYFGWVPVYHECLQRMPFNIHN